MLNRTYAMRPLSWLRLEIAGYVINNPHLSCTERKEAFQRIKEADKPMLEDLLAEYRNL